MVETEPDASGALVEDSSGGVWETVLGDSIGVNAAFLSRPPTIQTARSQPLS